MPSPVPPSVLNPPQPPDTRALVGRNVTNVATTYVISVMAASVAEILTYPLDLTKTRLQIQGERAAKTGGQHVPYRGMMSTALGIINEEGFLALWRGVPPALWRHVIYSGMRIVCYENIRNQLIEWDPNHKFPLWKSALTGATSGAVSQYLASPADLVKVQIQMEGRRRLLGLEPRVHGTWHAFTKIIREGGVRGLWKGSIPNVHRAALVNLGDLTTYDTAKRLILANTDLKDNHFTHIICSGCAGLVAAGLGTPADVVKTRVMNQPTDDNGRGLLYKSSMDCLRKTVAEEGVLALYKGFLPIWIRMAPWSLTFWLCYEQIRHTWGVAAF